MQLQFHVLLYRSSPYYILIGESLYKLSLYDYLFTPLFCQFKTIIVHMWGNEWTMFCLFAYLRTQSFRAVCCYFHGWSGCSAPSSGLFKLFTLGHVFSLFVRGLGLLLLMIWHDSGLLGSSWSCRYICHYKWTQEHLVMLVT